MQLSRIMGHTALAISCLVAAFTVQAEIQMNAVVKCPSPSKVRNAASFVDTAMQANDGTYIAYSSNPVFMESDLNWRVGSIDITASNNQEAITTGKNRVAKAHSKMQEDAMPIPVGQVCGYFPSTSQDYLIVAVGTDAKHGFARFPQKFHF